MIFAIQEINQRRPKILPGVTIGYDIYDTCGDVSLALKAALQLLREKTDPRNCFPLGNNSAIFPEPHAKVVIGERYSEVSIVVARVFALSSVTQISYGSTSELLSRKLKFPTFLRTVSSDAYQAKAIAELVKQFHWEIVGVVGSDDEYGKYGSERLIDELNKMTVCIDFKNILPGYFGLDEPNSQKKLTTLMSEIKNSSAEAIVLFTKDTNVEIIMEAAIQMNLNRTWIATDSWSTSQRISTKPGIQKVGTVYGFISKRNEVPGFEDYVTSMVNKNSNSFPLPPCSRTPRKNNLTGCSLTNMSCPDPSCLLHYIDQDESYNIYLAVKVIAEGLRSLLKCDSKKCQRNASFTALELLNEIKQVNFTVDNITHIFFDVNGDPSIGYDIMEWDMTDSEQPIKPIGVYWPSGNIKLPDDLVQKMHTVTVTPYSCYKTCPLGHELKKTKESCCKKCEPCRKGYFSSGGIMQCKLCKPYEYASLQNDKCLKKEVVFLNWTDPFVIVLGSFEVLGIVATILVAILFTVHRRTPIVKAVGGYLCFLELFSLLVCFCLISTFLGKPTEGSCKAGLPLFGMAFTLCVSCILANLFQILVGFDFDQKVGGWLKRLNQPVAVVAVFFGIQLTLCVLWLTYYPPIPEDASMEKRIFKNCSKGSNGFFGATLGYNALLASVCFLFAFKGKRLPDLYKNASFITISMLLFLVVWILFIPIYIHTVGKYPRAIEAAAILVSSYSVLCCHLVPKCHIMVFRKEINNTNAIIDYIRKHYEQKGITVGKS
ncbi:G-protein coupled receptor family C group 6 member A-like [Polymixia lowei]